MVVGIEPRAFISRRQAGVLARMEPASVWWDRLLDGNRRTKAPWKWVADSSLEWASRAYLYRERFGGALLNAGAAAGQGRLGEALAEVGLRAQELPVSGGVSWNHVRAPRQTLERLQRTPGQMRKYVRTQFEGRDPYEVREAERRPLLRLAERCGREGVAVVFVETPASAILREYWPSGTAEGFEAELRALEEAEARVVRVGELGVEFTDALFREQSHLNLAGAEAYSRAVTELVVVPVLGGRGPTTEGTEGTEKGGTREEERKEG